MPRCQVTSGRPFMTQPEQVSSHSNTCVLSPGIIRRAPSDSFYRRNTWRFLTSTNQRPSMACFFQNGLLRSPSSNGGLYRRTERLGPESERAYRRLSYLFPVRSCTNMSRQVFTDDAGTS